MTTPTRQDDDAKATDLTTLREVAACFVQHRSPRILLFGATAIVAVRLLVGDFTAIDAAVVVLTIVLTGPVEWFLHLFLLLSLIHI